ncbi:triose-phosphate isomerase [Helicobacter sp. MIT 00-7814]|uniref:triose-phosphate isomerase n=1 Tax=unclassified Helicobacter TaxID=2593540 RepID=UPI000E1E3650|nr:MULTISPECIES: triose-phosphate isomerase [unclassified Helicobacter]RDU57183.1 triose-phosphate isomerase [Helicobacter sp. MIT 00-7814]RDU57735.1 triose-phosphate isomerase [Helicobacter sp. MIT 99-10781]
MGQTKIIAANFKCNLTRAQTKSYVENLDSTLTGDFKTDSKAKARVVVFPNQSALLENKFRTLTIGAQNAINAQNGAFTGEIGLEQLAEFGINTILIGHSERRSLFGENQKSVAQKFAFFKEQNFSIFYCIGESLEVRQNGKVAEFLQSQFEGIDVKYKNLIIAYEPIWAIGTGVSASLKEIQDTHEILRNLSSAPLLYGGSVNEKNAREILSLPNVDGVLVGSASLEREKFLQIIDSVF